MLNDYDKADLRQYKQELKTEYKEDIQHDIDYYYFSLEQEFTDFEFEQLVLAEEALKIAPTRKSNKLFEIHIKQSVIDYKKQQRVNKKIENNL